MRKTTSSLLGLLAGATLAVATAAPALADTGTPNSGSTVEVTPQVQVTPQGQTTPGCPQSSAAAATSERGGAAATECVVATPTQGQPATQSSPTQGQPAALSSPVQGQPVALSTPSQAQPSGLGAAGPTQVQAETVTKSSPSLPVTGGDIL